LQWLLLGQLRNVLAKAQANARPTETSCSDPGKRIENGSSGTVVGFQKVVAKRKTAMHLTDRLTLDLLLSSLAQSVSKPTQAANPPLGIY